MAFHMVCVLLSLWPSLGLVLCGWRGGEAWVAMVAIGMSGLVEGGTGRGLCALGKSWVLLALASAARHHWSRPDRPAGRG